MHLHPPVQNAKQIPAPVYHGRKKVVGDYFLCFLLFYANLIGDRTGSFTGGLTGCRTFAAAGM